MRDIEKVRARVIPLDRVRVGTTMVLAAVALTGGAAGTQADWPGVSERHPTGSPYLDSRGLVAAFDMETVTPTGRLRDYGVHGNHGEIGGTVLVPGYRGRARRFADPRDRIHLPENQTLDLDGPLTIALWMRVETLDLHQHVIACDDKFALWVTPRNRLRFSDTLGRGMDTAAPLDRGRWYSVVAVFSGRRGDEVSKATVRLYLDGEAAETVLVNRPGDDPPRWLPGALYLSDACYIGFESHQGNAAHQELPFHGIIDELLVFRRALTADEIRVYGGAEH